MAVIRAPGFDLIHMHRPFNIFEISKTEIFIAEFGNRRQLVKYGTRYSNTTGRCKLLNSCCNVDPISINIVAVVNHFADIYSNSEFD